MTSITAAKLDALNVKWGEMMNTSNAKGLADMYTEDCRVLPPGIPVVEGRAAFAKVAEEIIMVTVKGATLTTQEIQPNADHAPEGTTFWERGHYVFNKVGGVTDTGKYIATWKKMPGGNLEVDMDCWNSSVQ